MIFSDPDYTARSHLVDMETRVGGTMAKWRAHQVLRLYRSYMGGVDAADRDTGMMVFKHRCDRWVMRLFGMVVDNIAHNSRLLHEVQAGRRGVGRVGPVRDPKRQWKWELATSLMKVGPAEGKPTAATAYQLIQFPEEENHTWGVWMHKGAGHLKDGEDTRKTCGTKGCSERTLWRAFKRGRPTDYVCMECIKK
jgi:hypothetical protein